MVGPLADTLYTDWYGGKLPYRVTPLDGIKERSAPRTVRHRGRRPDRAQGPRRRKYLTAPGTGRAPTSSCRRPRRRRPRSSTSSTGARASSPCAASPTASTSAGQLVHPGQQPGPAHRLVRAAAVQARGAGRRDDAPPVRRIRDRRRLVRPGHLRHGRRPTARSSLATAAGATHFTKETVTQRDRRGRRGGEERRRGGGRGRQHAVHQRPRGPRPDGHATSPRARRRWSRRSARPTRTPSWCWRTATRRRIDRLQDKVPAILWTTHAGAETGHAAGRRPVRRRQPGRPSHPDLAQRRDRRCPTSSTTTSSRPARPTCTARATPLYAFGHGLSYTTFGYQGLKAVPRRATATR